MQSNHKTTFKTKHDRISSKLITKHVRVTLYMVTLSRGAHDVGGEPNKFCKKNALNIIVIYMQITSQFGQFAIRK